MLFLFTSCPILLVLFVLVDDLSSSFLIIERIEDLVESRISLLVVEEIDKLGTSDGI